MRPSPTPPTAVPAAVAREQLSAAPLQPRGVAELVDDAAALFRSAVRPFLLSSALVLVPTGCLQILLSVIVPPGDDDAFLALSSLLQLLAFAIGLLLLASAQVWIAYTSWRGLQPDVRAAFEAARPLMLPMAGAGLLYMLAILGMSITVIGIPFAIHFAVAWVLAVPALVIERRAPRAALRRSRTLVKGHWWRVVGLVLVLTLVQTVVAFGFRIPGLFFGADSLFFNPGDDIPRLVVIADIIGNIAARMVLTPLSLCATVLLYLDQRVRNEGLDIEQQAHELGFRLDDAPVSAPLSATSGNVR